MDYFQVKGPETLISMGESFNTEEKVEIYKTAIGRYRVIHTVYTEDFHNGDVDYHDLEEVCDNGNQAFQFLFETYPSFIGDLPSYVLEALDEAETKDDGFSY